MLWRGRKPGGPKPCCCSAVPGVRSREAAEILAGSGFKRVFNVLEGFEGEKDASGQRQQGGWKARGLPWFHS